MSEPVWSWKAETEMAEVYRVGDGGGQEFFKFYIYNIWLDRFNQPTKGSLSVFGIANTLAEAKQAVFNVIE